MLKHMLKCKGPGVDTCNYNGFLKYCILLLNTCHYNKQFGIGIGITMLLDFGYQTILGKLNVPFQIFKIYDHIYFVSETYIMQTFDNNPNSVL